jgi:hypothetical protein
MTNLPRSPHSCSPSLPPSRAVRAPSLEAAGHGAPAVAARSRRPCTSRNTLIHDVLLVTMQNFVTE